MKKILILIVSVLILTSCKEPNSVDDSKTVLRFATWASDESLDEQQKLVDQFNNQSSTIFVKLEAYGDDFDTKITAGMGSKDAPDVMYMWNYPKYYEGLEALDEYIEQEGAEFKEDYYDALWNYNTIEGTIYGIPIGFATHAVYYNKDLFDLYNIDYPDATWTWDEFTTIARKLTDDTKGHYGLVLPAKPDPYDFEMYLWSNGTAYQKDGKLNGHINSKEALTVFNEMQKYIADDLAIMSEDSGTDEMKTGNVGMFIYGTWGIAPFNESGLNYGVVELPNRDGKESVSIVNTSGLAISKHSQYKEEAFEFIKFWTGEEGSLARIEHELPSLKSVVEKQSLHDDEILGVFYSMLEKSDGYTPSSFTYEDWSELSSEISLSFERIFNPTTLEDPKQVFEELIEMRE
ncbi:MAG TPA: sugar ABC transporter substrate-binding protein [Erysipelothrix sp.]